MPKQSGKERVDVRLQMRALLQTAGSWVILALFFVRDDLPLSFGWSKAMEAFL